MATGQGVTVRILDKEYRINCSDQERADLESSARYLDQKMSDIRSSGRVVGLDRIAVMAALNITHELLTNDQKVDGLTLNMSERIQALQNKLDFTLEAMDTPPTK